MVKRENVKESNICAELKKKMWLSSLMKKVWNYRNGCSDQMSCFSRAIIF